VIFAEGVAKSVKRWPILCDFRERWPSQKKGGQYYTIFVKGGQVSREVAFVLFLQKGGQVSEKVAFE
jgi:hypothetical protein